MSANGLVRVKLIENWEIRSGQVVPKGQYVELDPLYVFQMQQAGKVAKDKVIEQGKEN